VKTSFHFIGIALAVFAAAHSASSQLIVTRQFTVNRAIPDAGELVDAQLLGLAGSTISDVRVTLDIERRSGPGFNGDLYVALGHDTGYTVLLNRPGKTALDDVGYSDGDGFGVTFSDAAAGDIHNYRLVLSGNANTALAGSLTGVWQPDGRNIDPNDVLDTTARTAMLSSFNGSAVDGQWRLLVSDVSAGGLSRLKGWGVSVTTAGMPESFSSLAGDVLEFLGAGEILADSVEITGDNTIAGSHGVTFSGELTGSGSLDQSSTGTLVLAGANSFAGGVSLSAGKLALGHNQAAGAGMLTLGGGSIESTGGTRVISNPLTFSGNTTFGGNDRLEFSGPGTLTGTRELTINAATTLAGSISESSSGLGIVKRGSGRLTLTGANTFGGGLTVAEGTLFVNNTIGSATGSGTVTIESGATLAGAGRISGALTLNAGARISPGSSPGTLHTGSEIWAGGAAYEWEINQGSGTLGADPGSDLLEITGSLTLTATAGNRFRIDLTSLTLGGQAGAVHDFNSDRDYTWTIVTTTGGINGFDAALINLNTSAFQNNLNGGAFTVSLLNSGQNLALNFNAVPEPADYALVIGIGLAIFSLSRVDTIRARFSKVR
jgi:autotransporter-associated beta strand protein